MSFRGTQWAFDAIQHYKLGQATALVAVFLGHSHNQETGRCDPSIKRMCQCLNLSRSTVIRAVKALEKVGAVVTTKRTRRTGRGQRNLNNRYRLVGGSHLTPRVVAICDPNMKDRQPAAFHDLAMSIDVEDEA